MHVLLVDRDPVVVAMLRTFVERNGHQIETFDTIDKLLGRLAGTSPSPDLILLDLSLLAERGATSVESSKTLHPRTHWTLMATTCGAVLPPGTAFAHGRASHLQKPVRMGDIEALFLQVEQQWGNKGAAATAASSTPTSTSTASRAAASPLPSPTSSKPAASGAGATAAATVAAGLAGVNNPKCFLAVDDSPIIQKMYRIFITEQFPDSKLLVATNGHEALEMLRKNPEVDVVLLDLHMPIMGGLDLLQELEKDRGKHKLPVIVVTTDGKQEEVIKGLRRGARGYLVKPFTGEVLRDMIDVIMHRDRGGH